MARQGAERNITITKYRTYLDSWALTDINGDPVDLTDHQAVMDIKTDTSSDAIISLTVANGRVTMGGALGTVVFNIDKEDTALLTAGGYIYDIKLLNTDTGVADDVMYGCCRIVDMVTQ